MCAIEQYRADALSGIWRTRLIRIAGASAIAVLLAILVILGYFHPSVQASPVTGSQVIPAPQETAKAEPAGVAIACGAVTLPRSYRRGDVVASGHLPGRSFAFLFGLKDAYARGQLTVMPGIVCRDGRIGFGLFGGVSRQADYFDLKMIEGRLASHWSYLEQWLIEEKVTFDNGATVVVDDPIMGAEVPAGAKRVVRIELRMWSGRDAQGRDSQAVLAWE